MKQKSVLIQSDEAAMKKSGTYMVFPYINSSRFYMNEKELADIRELARGSEVEDMEALDRILIPYVQQFGIENFRRDTSLLWLAGRVKHILKDTARAVYFYDLARMHNRGTRAPKLAYDSLTAPTRSEWLPIDKYYELLEVRKRIDSLIPPPNVLTTMGDRVNSADPDYAPFVHPSNTMLVFTSRRTGQSMRTSDFVDPYASYNEDIYYTEVDWVTNEWKPAQKLNSDINSKYNEGSASLDPDGKTLYFTRCRDRIKFTDRNRKKNRDTDPRKKELPTYGGCDIYSAEFAGTLPDGSIQWKNIKNLGAGVNSENWDSQPNISADGQMLFFASNRKSGFGGTDIYVSHKEGNAWGPAQNLGPNVNTPNEEVTPYFHKINNTLYYSSTGHYPNFGSFDIFKSRWMIDRWEQANNLGPLVNTRGNQYYFSIDGEGSTIFYADAKDTDEDHVKQNFDLYSFPMPMEARPDAIATLKGSLVDSVSGYVLQGTVMIIDMENNREVAPKEINDAGYFEFDLINNNRYKLFVLGDNFLTIERDFLFKGDTTFQIFTQSFEDNKPIVFESMRFRSNSTKLQSSVKPKLDYIVRFLKNYPMFRLEIEGHTDSDGPEDANLSLSIARANSIRDYIIEKGGFDLEKVSSTGYGETRPIVPNDTDENKEKNRRVEFKLIMDDGFEGDMWLPTEEELFFDKNLFKDEEEEDFEIMRKDSSSIEMTDKEKESWEGEIMSEDEMDMEEDIDLEAELEADILKAAEKKAKEKSKTTPKAENKTGPSNPKKTKEENKKTPPKKKTGG
ncbi:MAG: OmpA family protein [Bacteroidota bacterium]